MENNSKIANNLPRSNEPSINKRTNHKKYIIVIFLFILFLIDAGLFFIWYKNKDTGEKGLLEQDSLSGCLNSVIDISEDNLIKLVNDSGEEIYQQNAINEYDTGDIFLVLSNYFVCKSKNDSKYYNEAIDYFSKLKFPSQDKEKYISYINRRHNLLGTDEDIRNAVAYGDIDTLCPEKLKDICFENQPSINEMITIFCNELCQYIEYSINDESFFNEGVLSLKWFYNFNNTEQLSYEQMILPEETESINWWRIALAYRVGGEEAAYMICDNFIESNKKERCINILKHNLDYIKLQGQPENCDFYFNQMKNLFCVYK